MSSKTENRRIYVWINGKEVQNNVKSIGSEFRKLRSEVAKAQRGSDEYNKKIQELRKAKAMLDEHRQKINGVSKSWQFMKNVAAGVFAGNLVTSAMQRITSFIPEMISANAELADSITDVQKTAGLTDQQMDKLMDRFKGYNTRTARKELLALAAEAGKMGYRGVDQISEYVEQTNELVTALGDDLGEGAGLKVAKMAELFDLSMRKIGSGINAAADNSKANAGFITDFLSRTAGSAKQVGIAAGDIIGYATALDEMGMRVEMSSTALNGFFIDFVKNTEKYGNAAGFANGELSKMIGEEGTNAGFLAFLQRLKETNPESDRFLQKLEDIGITGDRGAQVFLALSQNVEQLSDRQALANSEIAKGTSLTNEYNKRNQNFAANIEKINKWMHSLWTNSSILSGMKNIASQLVKLVTVEEDHIGKLENERTEMNFLIRTLTNQNMSQRARKKIIDEINNKYGEYLPALIKESDTIDQIRQLQELANKEFMKKIILQSYQEEITELLTQEKEALEGVENAEKSLAENRQKAFENSDPTMVQELEFMREQAQLGKELHETIINNTDERVKETEDKYKAMAEKVGIVWEELMSTLGGSTQVTFDKLNLAGEEVSEETNKLLEKMRAEIEDGFSEVGFDSIAIQFKEGMREAIEANEASIEQDYINGLITYEEYLKQREELYRVHLEYNQKLKDEYQAKIVDAERDMPAPGGDVSGPSNFMEWLTSPQMGNDPEMPGLMEALQKIDSFYQTAAGMYQQYLDILAIKDQNRLNAIDRQFSAEKDNYGKLLESKMISQKAYDYQMQQLEQQKAEREKAIRLAAWKRERRFSIIDVAINTALGISKAFAQNPPPSPLGFIGAGMVAANGALQTAAILAQQPPQFAMGGILQGPSHRSGGIQLYDRNTGAHMAEAEGGEMVLTKGVYRDPVLATMASALNVAGGGRPLVPSHMRANRQTYFETGGVLPKASDGGQAGSNQEMLDLMRKLVNSMEKMPSQLEANVSLDSFRNAEAMRNKADSLS